jgi:hypothetical protein
MPGVVSSFLNQAVVFDFLAADINAFTGWLGIILDTTGDKPIVLSGIDVSIFCFTPADYGLINRVNFGLRRNFVANPNLPWILGEDFSEMRMYMNIAAPFNWNNNLTRPLMLEAGYRYTAILGVTPSGVIGNTVRLNMAIRGEQLNSSNAAVFPYVLR